MQIPKIHYLTYYNRDTIRKDGDHIEIIKRTSLETGRGNLSLAG
jgi:hypothetical protein